MSGRVTYESGEPLIFAMVYIKGTTIATSVDIDGYYSIAIPDCEDAILTYSFLGMQAEEVPVKDRTVINITLREEKELEVEYVYAYARGLILSGAGRYAHWGVDGTLQDMGYGIGWRILKI